MFKSSVHVSSHPFLFMHLHSLQLPPLPSFSLSSYSLIVLSSTLSIFFTRLSSAVSAFLSMATCRFLSHLLYTSRHLHVFIHSFIHSDHFYSASSSILLIRSAPDTARILCQSFTPKRHRQL